MSSDTLVKVDGVSKKFCRDLKTSLWYGVQDLNNEIRGRRHGGDGALRPREFWAVKDVTFELNRGECIGLIGGNGAGKSTLLKMINGLIKPDQGSIRMGGRVGALIELNAGFNPILTGRENIYVNGQVLGLTKREIDARMDEIIAFAEIDDFLDMPVQNYSSGMKVRLGFAVAAQMQPDILIIDEVLAVGDIGFRIKCLNRIQDFLRDAAVIFVSHSMPLVARICNRVMVLDAGVVRYSSADVGKGMDVYYEAFKGPDAKISGTGEVQMIFVRCNGQSGDNIFVGLGKTLNLDVGLVVKSHCEVLSLRIGIFNQDQVSVYEVVCPDYNRYTWRNSGQDVVVRCVVPALDLAPGKHTISLAVHDFEKTVVLCRVDNAITFQVETRLATTAGALLRADFELSDL
jgi:lipopolysaccharide transport system ATP-binding protein